jgi:outer membrane usher protein
MLLEVTVNSQKLRTIIRTEKLADGRIALPVEAWNTVRLRPAGEKLALPDVYQGYALNVVQGLQYELDPAKLTLNINAPVEAFETKDFDRGRGNPPLPSESPPGFYLNYNLTATQADKSGISYGAFLESVACIGSGSSLVNGGVLRGVKDWLNLIRTETTLQKDLPAPMNPWCWATPSAAAAPGAARRASAASAGRAIFRCGRAISPFRCHRCPVPQPCHPPSM